MKMSICPEENGFSLDELVKKVADSYEKKAFADILKMNLQLTQEVLMYRILDGKNNMQYCSNGYLTLNGSFDRRIRTWRLNSFLKTSMRHGFFDHRF